MKYILSQSFGLFTRLATALTLALAAALPQTAAAFDLSTYAESSKLATGTWIKVSVPSTGLYKISRETLYKWGFGYPERVRVYGYGATSVASDVLSLANYVDDLPEVQSQVTDRGDVVFYAIGPVNAKYDTRGNVSHSQNFYTTQGYYFITESDEERRDIPLSGSAAATSGDISTYKSIVHYEKELAAPTEYGPHFVGEDFKYTPTRTFDFTLTDIVPDSEVTMNASFVAKTYNSSSRLAFAVNGNTLEANTSDNIAATSVDGIYDAAIGTPSHTFKLGDEKLSLKVSHSSSVTIYNAWLDFITLIYNRKLQLPTDKYLSFTLSETTARLGNADSDIVVWDVTTPTDITRMNTAVDSTTAAWTNTYTGRRDYAAWTQSSNIPEVTVSGYVTATNIHGMEPVNMIIFTHSAWRYQAERIALMHRGSVDRPLSVTVLDVNDVYNEFHSGAPDVNALRRCLKMFYDRGNAAGTPLQFVLLMGAPTFDNRHILDETDLAKPRTIPIWIGGTLKQTLSDSEGYTTDDYIAMLLDGSGSDKGLDKLCVAVGRMPVTTVSEAKNAVDKLNSYVNESKNTGWKNQMLFLADDEDQGTHMKQTDSMIANIDDSGDHPFFINKVYMDSYDRVGGSYPEAREEMFRLLDEGSVWWNYIGHANNHSWSHDGQLTYSDITSLYLKHVPVLYAATCDFLCWDSNTLSGGEIFFHERYGGTIASISATRPVYISENGLFSNAMGRHIANRDENGKLITIGQIYQNAKNDLRNDNGEIRSNTNRLRYVLMGDPAMALATPSNLVKVTAINGIPIDSDEQICIQGLQNVVIEGEICTPDGTLIDDYYGKLSASIYDAEFSTTSNGYGKGIEYTFERHGSRLFSGAASINAGRFTLNAPMPMDISDNFRPASMSLYATTHDETRMACGTENRFYVYGLDETAAADTTPPVISSMTLNGTKCADGMRVSTSPMLAANISDNVGINISDAGVGHRMTITLDGTKSYTDVSLYYTPATDGTPSGTINYPFEDLTEGSHTLTLKIWDTSGNSTTSTVDIVVDSRVKPVVYDVWCDQNPASTETNFYLSHDRADRMVTVSVTVYDLMGRPVWTGSAKGMSDMFTSSPVNWDLTDSAGRRVRRGIYVYRATVTEDGTTYESASRKLAVTAE